jgi:hypothetical protein
MVRATALATAEPRSLRTTCHMQARVNARGAAGGREVHHEGRRAKQKVRAFIDLAVNLLRDDLALQ